MIKWWKNPQVGMRIRTDTPGGVGIQIITHVDERGWIRTQVERCDWLPGEQWNTNPDRLEYHNPMAYSNGYPEEWKLDETRMVELALNKYDGDNA